MNTQDLVWKKRSATVLHVLASVIFQPLFIIRELLNDCDARRSSFKIPLRFPHPVPVHTVITAFLTFNTSPITLLIKASIFENSKVAIFGSFSFRKMFKMMQRTTKKTRYVIHSQVKIEYDTRTNLCFF